MRQTVRFRPVDQDRIEAIRGALTKLAPGGVEPDTQTIIWEALRQTTVALGVEPIEELARRELS